MKVTEHEARNYGQIVAELTRRDDMFFGEYVEVTSVLTRFWPDFLTPSELAALTFLLGRTLMFRKRAETVSKSQFLNGVTAADGTKICSGVGVSHNTLRTALEGLVEKGIVEIHAFLDRNTETISRVYEVKTAAIVENRDTEGVRNMLNRVRKTHVQQQDSDDFEGLGRGSKICTSPLQNLAPLKDILRISNVSTDVDTPTPSASGRGGAFKEPKKARVVRRANVCTSTQSAKERAEEILGKAKEKRTARASVVSVPTRKWDTKTLQALLDRAREDVGGSCPRITVTAKAIGVMHKRMLSAEVKNVVEFFTWALQNWTLVADANHKAKAAQLRARDTKAATSEMHRAPNFQDLAYRFPYFYRFFQDREVIQTEKKTEERQRTARATQQRQEQQAATLRRRHTVRQMDEAADKLRRQQDEEFKQRRRQRYRDNDQDDDLPEYEAPTWGG